MGAIIGIIHLVIQVLIWLIIIDAILTWIPSIDRRNPLVQLLRRVVEPVLAPIRQILPPQRTGYVDFSPLIAIVVLNIIDRLLISL
jgi:YggT family protein